MNKTFTDLVSDYKTLSRDSSDTNETLGKSLINTFIGKILVARDWVFNRSSYEDASVADQQDYPKPYNCAKIREIKVTAGGLNYFPKEVILRKDWNKLKRTTTPVTSDAVIKYFVDENHIELYPVPATSGNAILMYFQKLIKTLGATDYTTGTITATPARSTAIVGSGTTFTVAMVGRHIVPTDDGYPYEIESVESTTALTTVREIRIALSDSDYKIAELIPLPFGFQDIPLWFALAIYFQSRKDQIAQSREYERMARDGLTTLIRRDAKSTGSIITKSDLTEIGGIVDMNKFPDSIS